MKKAFTLIELLVVIAIIGVLAALLFPVFAKARENAKRIDCISHERQIGLAVSEYLADWDEKYPWAYSDAGVRSGLRPALVQIIQPFGISQDLWRCPSDIGETFLTDPTTFHQSTPPLYRYMKGLTSYYYPGIGLPRTYGGLAGVVSSGFRHPSSTILVWETRPWHGNYRPNELYADSPALYNILYCDGHVAQKKQADWNIELLQAP